MRYLAVSNRTRDRVLGTRVGVADRWWSRARGLLGHARLAPGDGLLLAPCRGVHMWGMRYALDVAFLDPVGAVVAIYPALPPGRRSRWHRGAAAALELPAGTLAWTGTAEGDAIEWRLAAGEEEP